MKSKNECEWAIKEWKARVLDQSDHVDPDNEQDWCSLAIGFFMGLGFQPADAIRLMETCLKRGLL